MRDLTTVSSRTRLCAVIGNPLGHSLSPAIHNAAFASLGLDYVYLAFQVEQAASAVTAMRALETFTGLSVTIPHKIAVLDLVDEVSPIDREIGAINTVVKEHGKLIGLGTDGPGALKALTDAGVALAGRRVLMLGAGGAARAIAYTLARTAGVAELALLDIDQALLNRLAHDLRAAPGAAIVAEVLSDETLAARVPAADVVVNCTPVGMHPKIDRSLVKPAWFRDGQTVFDIVYNPLKTRLLRDAEARGLRIVPGVEMFVNQAVLQFERFTGRDAPVDVMRRVVLEHLHA
jgi:shikimate dehydrogenase